MAVQLQWNLDYTLGAALSVGLDVFRAASRNNVQPLAILACEKFGNTIAMCQETCRKVERAMITTDPVPIAFLRASVGFFADDCASQLSRSLAGLQFLGLATALVTSMGPFESGLVLELLLKKSTSDRTLLPTARQLRDLLEAIEPRCNTCGFADSVIGWQTYLSGNAALSRIEARLSDWTLSNHRPSDEGIESLVNGLRQIARIGGNKKYVLSIETTFCAPWVIAFTKWCLGSPPSVTFEDDGQITTILDNPQSPVFVMTNFKVREHNGFRVAITSPLEGIADLIAHTAEMSCPWPQMITIETYGKSKLRGHKIDAGLANRAFRQALPYCIDQVLRNLRLLSDQEHALEKYSSLPEPSLNPLPEEQELLILVSRLTGVEDLPALKTLKQGIGILDLPVVELYLKKCDCSNCDASRSSSCLRHTFFRGLASIVADALALSLFGHSEDLLIRSLVNSSVIPVYMALAETVVSIVRDRLPSKCKASELLRIALCFVGHRDLENDGDVENRWLMSSKRGQAVYPRIFDTCEIERRGYMTLEWLPGLIQYGGDVHDKVLAPSAVFSQTEMSESLQEIPVMVPGNLSPYRFKWWIERLEFYLQVSIGAEDMSFTSLTRSPRQILDNVAGVRVPPPCTHDPDAALDEIDGFSTFTIPLEPKLFKDTAFAHVSVVACAGHQQARFFSLNGNDENVPMVMRGDTCLSCSLEYCREHGFDVLIL